MSSLWMLMSSILWGVTNPFMRLGAKKAYKKNRKEWIKKYKFTFIAPDFFLIITCWEYLLPFIINQLGSLGYYYTLKFIDLSIALPIVNTMTLLFSMLTGILLGERKPDKHIWLGVVLILCGVVMISDV